MTKHDPRTIELIVIHHSASNPDWTWKTIHAMHILKFKMFSGYHRTLERDGMLMDGRRIQFRGAHAPPNANRIGICGIGWNEETYPQALSRDAIKAGWKPGWAWTDQMFDKLIRVHLPYYCQLFPNAMICGHQQTKPTLCPGFDVETVLMERGWRWPERLLHGTVEG